jgi:hypothetical protein
MIQRTITVAALRVADTDTVQSKPTSMTDEERNSGCYWTFGGASEDEEYIHHTYVLHSPDEAPTSTCNPTEADIDERVRLLEVATRCPFLPNCSTDGASKCASFGGRFYLWQWGDITKGGDRSAQWVEVEQLNFEAELRRVAIRQLLAERGGK